MKLLKKIFKINLHRFLCSILSASLLLLFSGLSFSQSPDYSGIVKNVSGCVVSLVGMSANQQSKSSGSNSVSFHRGTGIVLSQNGYIVTNNHVVENADRYFVELNNGFVYEGEFIGGDVATDIAVIKIEINGHRACDFIDDNEEPRVGQLVLGIGSPFSLPGTVSEGIISYVDRPITVVEGYSDYVLYIQTDLLINPGNSGGPVVNLDGKIIGMNTSTLSSDSGDVSGIAFAIPANTITRVSRQLIRDGFSVKGSIGVQVTSLPQTVEQIKRLGLIERRGAVLSDVGINSSAYNAGLRVGDIVVTVNRVVVDSEHKFRYLIGAQEDGDIIRLSLIRAGKYFATEVEVKGMAIGSQN